MYNHGKVIISIDFHVIILLNNSVVSAYYAPILGGSNMFKIMLGKSAKA